MAATGIVERVFLPMGERPPGENWHSPERIGAGICRWTGPGTHSTIAVSVTRDREMLAVAAFERAASPDQLAGLRVEADGATVPHTVRDDIVPNCIVARLPARNGGPAATEIALVLPRTVAQAAPSTEDREGRQVGLCVISLSVIPARPALPARFPGAARLLGRIAPKLLAGYIAAMLWAQRLGRRFGLARREGVEGDFPLSHFDGLAYLRTHPEVEQAVREGRIASAVDHYLRHGYAERRPFTLASQDAPSRGTLEELIRPEFDGLAYARKYPDIAWGVRHGAVPSALHHYAHSGVREGRALPRVESGAEAKRGDFYDLFLEELLAHKQELWKGFEVAMARRRHEVDYELGVVRGDLAQAHAQIDALKAVVAGTAARSASTRPKLYIDAQHGLANRLKAFLSASVIAEKTAREVVLVWVPDHHCQCLFSDLFEHDGPVLSEPLELDRGNVRVYNYMEIEPGARKDEPIDLDTPQDIYIRSAYPLNTLLIDWQAENRLLRALRPARAVRDLVDSIDVTGRLGVHVRMEGGAGMDAHSYDSRANWSAEGHEAIQYWRSKSHCTNFMRRIDELLKEQPGLELFLATDTSDTYRRFREAYGPRVAYLERGVYDRSREQLVYALADAILLGKCARFMGSTWSTFSELAIRYSTGFSSVEMSGKDF